MPGQNVPYAEPSPEPDPELTARFKELNDRVNAELRAQIEREVRAKVAEEIYEADWANIPIWADDKELAAGHFTDRDLTSWLNTLGHAKAHPGCCKSCGCCTTCLASAFFDAVTATAARIARGEA